MLLHQQTVMVATLQQQLYQMHNDLKRVEDSNMRYYKAAGNLQTTFTTLKTGTMSTDERVCNWTMCLYCTHQRYYNLPFKLTGI